MNSFKKKIQSLIEQLPDEATLMWEFDQLDKFSNILAMVLDKIAVVYDTKVLDQLDDFDLEYFINSLYQAFNIQHNWIEANQHVLTPEKLEENTHGLIEKQNRQILQLAKALEEAKSRMPEILRQKQTIQKQNALNAQALKQFAGEEARLNELLNNQEQLVERKKDLDEARKAVETGKLETLANEINTLESQFKQAARQRQELLEKQTKYAQDLQLAIQQTESLNHASNVLQQMKVQLEHHQEALQKTYGDEAETLRVHVEFNQKHPGKAQSVAHKMQQVAQLLSEIDEEIKGSLPI